ncbi:hypothetical protein Ancab_012958 [Ancistrocladus abbreviatus]
MRDWAGPIIAAALFAFLSPGLIIQVPGKQHPVDFMNMKTSAVSILLHAVIYAIYSGANHPFIQILHQHDLVLRQKSRPQAHISHEFLGQIDQYMGNWT